MNWDEKPKEIQVRGKYLDAEFMLLKFLAENSTTSIKAENIYEYGASLADVGALLKEGLIQEEKIQYPEGIRVYYKISPSGYRFVKEEESRKWGTLTFIITVAILAISCLTLIVSMMH